MKVFFRTILPIAKIYRNSGTHLFLIFWRASHAVARYDRIHIRGSGFRSLTDFAILEVLLHKGPQPVNKVGKLVRLTSGSITTAVKRLEWEGLVERTPDQNDRRKVQVRLTESGHGRISASFESHAARLDELFGILSEAEKDRFADLVDRLGEAAEKAVER